METEKIFITERLIHDIVKRRSKAGLTCYELSEKTGHSKYWLRNIEAGKIKKITKENLILLYMTMEGNCDEEKAIKRIEQVLNQQVGEENKEWYDLIKIPKCFSEIQDDDILLGKINFMLENRLHKIIINTAMEMSIKEKQAALIALQNLYHSFYKNPEQAFALINIPVYGVSETNKEEYTSAINDLLAIGARYSDLCVKNKSLETIRQWKNWDKENEQSGKKDIHTAFNNFVEIIYQLNESINMANPDLFKLADDLCTKVSFLIEKGQPNVLKHYLKSFRIHDGKGFVKHIIECVTWFDNFRETYDLPYLYNAIDTDILLDIYAFLEDYGKIQRKFNI